MLKFRWEHWLSLMVLMLFSGMAQAVIYSSPILNEAEGLIEISPRQAKQLSQDYLTQRKLADQAEKNPSTIARDETDSRVRTPGTSIEALKILTQTEFNLGEYDNAFGHIAEAISLARRYQLPYLELDAKIVQTKLIWRHDGDASKARETLREIGRQYDNIRNADQLARGIQYKMTMLRADIASRENDMELAEKLFAEAKPYVDSLKSPKPAIAYHIETGQHYLNHERYNLALSELLVAYWSAVESNTSALLAKSNTLLAKVFYERRVLDKALVHLSQAADYYGNYEKSIALADVLQLMGDVYFLQGKYNLALVHYFNVIDHESGDNDIRKIIEIRISLAATYLQLYNFPLADQYLTRAEELLTQNDFPELKGKAALLNSGLAFYQHQSKEVIHFATEALAIGKSVDDIAIEQEAYRLLSVGYEQMGNYRLALDNAKLQSALNQLRQNKLNQVSEDAFRQQKEYVEQTLHLVGQEKELKELQQEHSKYQKMVFILFIITIIFFLWLLRRGYIIQRQNKEIDELNQNLFTHSRSSLRNLRMLNARLPSSLQESSDLFEQWHIGELIHEPLNDRLRFTMIDVPFLRNMYLENGYTEGLKLEKAFSEFLKTKISDPARLYHFSDANLLYIESNVNRDTPPEETFAKVQSWIEEFRPELPINRIIRIGITDYLFLPRAYTAINDKELLDILLMATSVSRELSLKEKTSHWVYLKAIDNAPAASFAADNIRKCCKQAINQGLIKVHSSYKNEEAIKKLLQDS